MLLAYIRHPSIVIIKGSLNTPQELPVTLLPNVKSTSVKYNISRVPRNDICTASSNHSCSIAVSATTTISFFLLIYHLCLRGDTLCKMRLDA